jgi:N4-gp56 family major capsid protein
MALTLAQSGLTPQQWSREYFKEFINENPFSSYMGMTQNSIIHLKEDLTKKPGDTVTFALMNRLTGAGVTGNTTLEGNEEALETRSQPLTVAPLRHAVAITGWERQKSAIDLFEGAKVELKNWEIERLRDDIILALGSINGTAYAAASEAAKDAWLVDNADRVLFGAAKSNNSGNDHSASLANIDSTNDLLTPGAISLMKRIAQTANPKIRPLRIKKGGQQWFMGFAGSRTFRDFANNATMTQASREARERGIDNPLFTGGDLIWDGVIIREIPDIPVIAGVGNGGIDVEPFYLCGAQAVGVAWAQRPRQITNNRDYGFINGVGIAQIRGIEKLRFGTGTDDTDDLKDHGIVTGYFSAVADS